MLHVAYRKSNLTSTLQESPNCKVTKHMLFTSLQNQPNVSSLLCILYCFTYSPAELCKSKQLPWHPYMSMHIIMSVYVCTNPTNGIV